MPTRRGFLKIIGGGTILAAGGGAAFVATRRPDAALAPWDVAPYADPRKSALAHAILAPNAHNRQPWLIELVGVDAVRIHRDPERDLPETDPFHRQLYISLGAFLETMVLAAGANGYAVDLTPLPDGPDGPVAYAQFTQGSAADPLAGYITSRHSNKEAYADSALSSDHVAALGAFATLFLTEEETAPIREMTKRAFNIETYTPHTLKESVDLMRVGKAEINANPDGIELRDPFLEVMRRIGQLDETVLMDTDHFGFQAQLNGYFDMLDATPHYAVISTEGNTRLDQLNAGRRLMRLALKTTELGIGLHPVSQALQEYPEMADEYALAHQLLAPTGHTVQMLCRLGYGPEPIATPRWPLESRILNDTIS